MIEIPEECDITLEHAMEHIEVAKESFKNKDYKQLIHDCNMAAAVLLNFLEQETDVEVETYVIIDEPNKGWLSRLLCTWKDRLIRSDHEAACWWG